MSLGKFRLSPGEIFDSSDVVNDLAYKSVKGGIVTVGSTVVIFAINLARTIVLARLLTPFDFGLIGMVAVFISFASMFKDAGLSIATVQKDKIKPAQISTLFWINLFISTSLGIILIIAAPFISGFYKKPELTLVTIALAISFILGGLMIQHQALLKRHMRFDLISANVIISTIVGVGVAILFAVLGWRYWALVFGTISATLSEVVFSFYFCPWIPGRPRKGTEIRSMLKFGIHLTVSSFFNYFSRNADNILIGKFIGAEGLGIYQKSYQLFRLPVTNILNPIGQVAMPALSSLSGQPDRYRFYYKKMIHIITALTFPISVYFFIESDFIINLVLGDQWLGAIPVFRLLALGGLVQPITAQSGIAMVSTGNSKRYLKWQIIYAFALVVSFASGIPFGINGLATAYAIAEYAILVPGLLYCYRGTPIKPITIVTQIAPAFLISLLAASVMLLIKHLTQNHTIFFRFIFASVFFIVYILVSLSRKELRETVQIFKDQFRSRYSNQ
jgi:PST family polysaccharide transporter